MSDPAVVAANTVLDSVRWFGDVGIVGEALVLDAAREALRPIRQWFKWWNHVGEAGLPEQAWRELARLIYTSEELKQ